MEHGESFLGSVAQQVCGGGDPDVGPYVVMEHVRRVPGDVSDRADALERSNVPPRVLVPGPGIVPHDRGRLLGDRIGELVHEAARCPRSPQ